MSAEAAATLRQIWEKLTIHRVSRVIAREPEDVLSITVLAPQKTENGFHYRNSGQRGSREVESKRTADIPVADRWKTRVAWRHFYGFTKDGIYFNRDNAHGPDCNIDLTMKWSTWSNKGHKGTFDKPEVGSLIAGVVIDTPRGKRFEKWFECSPEFACLLDIVQNGTKLSENELAAKLLTGEHAADIYWAIARLLLFDNVQAFVDELKERGQRPPHPCLGQEYGESWYLEPNAPRPRVDWIGMHLSMSAPKFVHTISHTLGEPKWWAEFKRLAAEQKLEYDHPGWGNYCYACSAEKRLQDPLHDYWPY